MNPAQRERETLLNVAFAMFGAHSRYPYGAISQLNDYERRRRSRRVGPRLRTPATPLVSIPFPLPRVKDEENRGKQEEREDKEREKERERERKGGRKRKRERGGISIAAARRIHVLECRRPSRRRA